MTLLAVLEGDFKLFFEAKLESQESNPVLKKKSLAKIIQTKACVLYFYFFAKWQSFKN